MSEVPQLPSGAQADPDNPGWFSWGDFPRGSFAAATGKLLFRPEGEGRARCRIIPDEGMLNIGGSIHGGAVMSFIDMALFAGGRCAGMGSGHYVTLDCSVHFIARGRIGVPLDAEVRLIAETPGGHIFLAGTCEQEGKPTHSFTGTLTRVRPRQREAASAQPIAGWSPKESFGPTARRSVSDADFWSLVDSISEPGGWFRIEDNFTSNETEVGQIFTMLRESGVAGDVFIGAWREVGAKIARTSTSAALTAL